MSKHTPGTWLQSGRTVLSTRKQHLMIAQCVKSSVAGLNFSAEIDAEESDANARLIAAAPEMLEALQECEDYFDNRADADCDQDGYIPNKEMQLLKVVREALGKAGA